MDDRQLIADLLSALEYHTEQTRPIQFSKVAIEAAREYLRKPAQQEPKIGIYRSFEQWKSGNVLERGVPRTEYYSEAQLDLVEMGWNYGYDAGRAVEQALDKMAENARELGLDYEPAQQELTNIERHERNVQKFLAEQPAQRTWVDLTDDEIKKEFHPLHATGLQFARAVLAKSKEKNT